jgi:hypothetical protein
MKSLLILTISMFFMRTMEVSGQTVDVLRLKIINPGIAFEKSLGKSTTLETGIGFGYNLANESLEEFSEGGWQYIFAPFVDIQGRKFYNLGRRERNGKSIEDNSGNFVAARILYTGPAAASSTTRFSDHTFAVGPTWGFQRNYGKINFQTSVGPTFNFDTLGNSGWSIISIELNLGLNLNRKY